MTGNDVNGQVLIQAQNLSRTGMLQGRSLNRLSSGLRMISASDDPIGTGLSEKLSAQNKRVEAARINVQNTISFMQSVDGFFDAMSRVLTRMSELSMMARDPMKNTGDVALYQQEFVQLQDQIRATIGGTTAEVGGVAAVANPMGTFNGKVLFGPNSTGTVVATGQASTNRLTIPETNLRDGAMLAVFQQDSSGNFLLSVTDLTAVQVLADGMGDIADERATLGAIGVRLELIVGSLGKEGAGLTRDVSTIRDLDVATESTRLMKYQLLSQTGVSLLAQSNSSPKSVLKLLS